VVKLTATIVAMIAFLSMAVPARADDRAYSAAETGLIHAEDARFRAQVEKDVATVGRGMADGLLYTHANGRVQTKAEYLQGLTDAKSSPQTIESRDRIVRVFGQGGMIRGVRHVFSGTREMIDSYLAVYERRDGRWQLLAWQTSPDPSASPPSMVPPPR
jgi:hypothetical protein